MRKFFLAICLVLFLPVYVSATDISPPEAPVVAEKYMPEETESFGEGLWFIVKEALSDFQPNLTQAAAICAKLIAIMVLLSVVNSIASGGGGIVDLVGVLSIGVLILQSAGVLIDLGIDTVNQMSAYGKLLLPVMTAAMASQGAINTSASLYAGTTIFNTVISSAITKFVVPMIYILMALCVADSAVGDDLLKNIKKFLKWLITWSLKIALYVFTGYITVTGVISGSADAYAIKAAKIALSGVVPVVGGIISDASETILVSMGVMKSAAGVYGLLAILATCVGPFFKIGVQYLLLKVTAAVCSVFGTKSTVSLIQDFSAVMGYILAMTGTVCLLLLISTVCFMKGVL